MEQKLGLRGNVLWGILSEPVTHGSKKKEISKRYLNHINEYGK